MPPEPTAVCGTYAAAVRHMRRGEPVDRPCKDAYDKYRAEAVAKHRAKNGGEIPQRDTVWVTMQMQMDRDVAVKALGDDARGRITVESIAAGLCLRHDPALGWITFDLADDVLQMPNIYRAKKKETGT